MVQGHLHAVSELTPTWVSNIIQSYEADHWISHLKDTLASTINTNNTFVIHQGLIRKKGKICVGYAGSWR
jgi:hypothetical protein